MKFILLLLIVCFSLCGCKHKELSSDYLSNIKVIRETENTHHFLKAATPEQDNNKAESTSPQVAAAVYHVIVASFSYAEKTRAERLVEKLKKQGYPATIINSAQRYRVSIESFPTEEEAKTARDKYRVTTDRQDIWVLK